ncbi:MAG TPA: bacillithiol biosynthesis deacetylase BshB1 [Phycisphaerales bacterium]|jgi:bacillithiol biosynthesis deacetylase BshB1|nr:bacillithiol biosynthesis deacetylase BshB1 [Phycisphaerales bacterium]HIB01528.1 bacillithiol biosynthesis deacetylase BshB1 [Phycisphaerales bacterium]HIB49805.1 bacillithiol biosynthesis deacetylase BshB1 [Phycisphaerales bacterium]HIN84746.1 bacillithiol biosynthesis deacetylase BshB1 [Phycisphaerales bacterium]HIO19986.1 bacillithiol biosynthesis deacetylase BshB1 [Phycisphaerales bacterium]
MTQILVVGPHPDDQELGMGGTIAKLVDQGHDVLLLDMTSGEPTPHGSPEIRAIESAAAAEILGVKRVSVNLPNRYVEHSIPARHAVAAVIREHQAEIVFTPYFEDAHPDHIATTKIVEDARFDAKLTKIDLAGDPIYPTWLFYYYCTHLRIVPNPSFLVDTTGFAKQKRDSIVAYESQFVIPENNRPIVDWVEAQDAYFGGRLRTETAEPFFTREPIGLTNIDGLV